MNGSRDRTHPILRRLGWSIVILGIGGTPVLGAQQKPVGGFATSTVAQDRARIAELLDTAGHLPAAIPAEHSGRSVRVIEPTIAFVWNSLLPSEGGKGQLWAGRGANVSVTGGVSLEGVWSGVTIAASLAPSYSYSQNRPFEFLRGRESGRSDFSSPWHLGIASADLPSRFGDHSVRTLGPGASRVSLTAHGVTAGVATGTEWWGPALRNTLVLSDNAAGIPRLFLQSVDPIRTRVGEFDARLIIGTLTESAFFDTDPSNDYRSASALLVTYRPALDTLLTLGFSRLVIAPIRSRSPLSRSFDVLRRWETMASDSALAVGHRQSSDQLFSLFARWKFPTAGLEAYGEWARMDPPGSLRDLLVVPQRSSAYTIGAQIARARSRGVIVRGQLELSYLEQTSTAVGRPTTDYYTGRATAHGFTQRGQLLGASTGPGSSSQFIATDWLALRWQMGVFAGRVRRENDALYRQPFPRFNEHDVELYAGVRAGLRLPSGDISTELTAGRRRNYLFENSFYVGDPVVANDVRNVTLSFTVSPPASNRHN